MKYSKTMQVRIKRTNILFKELGFEISTDEETLDEDTYAATFNNDNFDGLIFIDSDSKFLEIAFTFAFSKKLGIFVKERLEEMLQICYEFGCYLNIQTSKDDISFSAFSKIYFSGLNYYSLRDTIKDFKKCIKELEALLDINNSEFE